MNMHARLSASAAVELTPIDYVAGLSFDAFVCRMRERHPMLVEMLDPACADDACMAAEILRLNELSWEFEGEEAGGRGDRYNRAQLNIGNRRIGMMRLLGLFGPSEGRMAGRETVILDALAGDGTLRRFAERLGDRCPEIVSADM